MPWPVAGMSTTTRTPGWSSAVFAYRFELGELPEGGGGAEEALHRKVAGDDLGEERGPEQIDAHRFDGALRFDDHVVDRSGSRGPGLENAAPGFAVGELQQNRSAIPFSGGAGQPGSDGGFADSAFAGDQYDRAERIVLEGCHAVRSAVRSLRTVGDPFAYQRDFLRR